MVNIPDYRGGSIVNLMSSLTAALGQSSGLYPELRALPATEIATAKNTVLMVIDGLGYEYLTGPGAGSVMHQHLHAAMDAVAPPTTAASISCFLTGDAPQQHGLTGWFTWLRELGSVVTVLPFQHRAGRASLFDHGITPEALFGHRPVFDRMEVDCYSLMPDWLVESEFNRAHLGKAQIDGHRGSDDYFGKIEALVRASEQRKYIYAYWPSFDAIAHDAGVASKKLAQHFAKLDRGFSQLLENLAGSDTRLILTADHGFIDTDQDTRLSSNDHPELLDCLQIPLCGEPRLAYAYPRPDKRQAFIDYIHKHLAHAVELHNGRDLIAQGLYGLGEPHPELHSRVGDLVLQMKANYIMTQRLPGEPELNMIGQHGGLSSAEMRVPLVTALL